MWKAIQKEINFLRLNIDIGLFDKNNNNYICNKFKEIIMKYHNDLDENKKPLYNNINRDQIQFKLNNYIINNKNDINYKDINKSKTFNLQKNNNDYNIKNNEYQRNNSDRLILIQARLK